MKDTKLDFKDVLMLPKKSPSSSFLSRKNIQLEISYKNYTGLPLIVSNMPSTGTYAIAKILSKEKILTFIYKDHPISYHLKELENISDTKYIGLTTGIHDYDLNRVLEIIKERSVGFINLDTANIYGNFKLALKSVERLKKHCGKSLLVVGNICTPDVVPDIVKAGADIIKVGIGSGSACITRSEIGVGVPQWSALVDIFKVTQKFHIPIISDGGCVFPGDICKALGAGANFVMLAGLIAGAIENNNKVSINGKDYINFYGLGSKKQFELTHISEKDYRSVEGRNLLVPCDVSILDHFKRIKNALRSACAYLGVTHIKDLQKTAEFIRVSDSLNSSLAKYENENK